ncbi:MAG TPA: hypothetical protein VEY51_14350, partial [Chondromyces sp.]|nr:hypothetical protein [Chondromyces sp.]
MNLYSKEFCPEIWDAWMKKMFLDPFTTILDDTQFRVDLFETTNEIIIEICIEDLNPTECFIKKDGKDLMIFLRMPGKRDRYRKITFPFELDYHFVQATWE